MNTINIPGFSAAGSLYRTTGTTGAQADGFNSALSVVPALCYPEGCGDCVGGWETCYLGGHASRRPCTAALRPMSTGRASDLLDGGRRTHRKELHLPPKCGPCQRGGQQWCTDTQCRVSSQPCNTCKAGRTKNASKTQPEAVLDFGGAAGMLNAWSVLKTVPPPRIEINPIHGADRCRPHHVIIRNVHVPQERRPRRDFHQVCGWQMNWWVGFFTWQCDTLSSEVLFCQPES